MKEALDCAAELFRVAPETLQQQLVETLRPLEAEFDSAGCFGATDFRTIVDAPTAGAGEITFADALAIDDGVEVGEDIGHMMVVGRDADVPRWDHAIANANIATDAMRWIVGELRWWAVARPLLELAPLPAADAAQWLGLSSAPASYSQLLINARRSSRASADSGGVGWPWGERVLHLMSEAWSQSESDSLQQLHDTGVPAGSAASVWREGYVPVFVEDAGDQVETLWVVDTREGAATYGHCLDLCFEEPFGYLRLIQPGTLFALLKDFDSLLGLRDDQEQFSGAAFQRYRGAKVRSLIDLIEWEYVEY